MRNPSVIPVDSPMQPQTCQTAKDQLYVSNFTPNQSIAVNLESKKI
ncbi:uncharacterized protein METZ01_LOCUS294649 [marine metagenome]|uniref:Uncharacterized protein n=1 Tax=marine metagenome TaxID=408172 RepID=A0A382M1H9_9ZZZZ